MSADPEADNPQHDERTQQALERLSQVIWHLLQRLDEREREAQRGATQGAEGKGHVDQE